MKKLESGLLLIALVAAGCAPAIQKATPPTVASALVVERPPFDPKQDDLEIGLRRAAVARDPKGAIGWSMLSAAYLRRARARDSMEDAVAAEQAAQKSLRLRTRGNVRGACRLVQALLEQHRFRDARKAVRLARQVSPGDAQARQLEAEILIELGDYEAAEQAIRQSAPYLDRLSRLTLTARMREIDGHPDQALGLMRQAQKEADANGNMTREAVAWYHVRVGNLLLATGQGDEAEAAYRRALDLYPMSYKAMSGMTKLAAGRGDWKAVVKWGHKTEGVVAMPEILALMGDAYAELGDRKMAEEHYGEVVALAAPAHHSSGHTHAHAHAGGKPHAHAQDETKPHGHTLDRQYAAFAADHGRAKEALEAARRDLRERHDVLAYDTLAWAAFKAGRQAEAEAAIAKALARGTRDARILYHAGMIRLKSPQKAQAKALLKQALALGPALERTHARDAQRALQSE